MFYYCIKLIISALLIVSISELSKINTFVASALVSLPIVSIISFIWIYAETKNSSKIAGLSLNVFWLVLPSLVFFLVLPLLLKLKIHFIPAMLFSILIMISLYFLLIMVLKKLGMQFYS